MRLWSVVMTTAVAAGCAQAPVEEVTSMSEMAQRRAQFVQKTLTADLGHLSDGDRVALAHLVEAADAMQEIFELQAWADRQAMDEEIAVLDAPDAGVLRDYYRIMVGPWDRLTGFEPFYSDIQRPKGAGYYPADMTAEEFETWIDEHPEDAEAFTGLHTVIRRDGDQLVAIPYSDAFAPQLKRAAASLRAAAEATSNESLQTFLNLRADAFASDDYFDSDMAWMDLDSDLEIVIGPYETYEDSLFGYKAAFEAFLCVASPEDSAALTGFKARLPLLETSLPIPDEHKNFDRGSESPIRVADQYYVAGDARAGVQTLAFNLPNDERVREAKGSKKVLLKNVMRAKYEAILQPIAGLALPVGADSILDFDAYFMFILFHEMSHGLGPGQITVDGRETEVRLELRDLYSALEEAKADTLGVWDLYVLADEGDVDPAMLESLPWTYTAGLFRAARFGVDSAHGQGVVMQANYLVEAGAMEIDADGRFAPVVERFRPAIKDLATELLMIQAEGDYPAAQDFVATYGSVRPEMQTILDALTAIPVDIDPVFDLEERS